MQQHRYDRIICQLESPQVIEAFFFVYIMPRIRLATDECGNLGLIIV